MYIYIHSDTHIRIYKSASYLPHIYVHICIYEKGLIKF